MLWMGQRQLPIHTAGFSSDTFVCSPDCIDSSRVAGDRVLLDAVLGYEHSGATVSEGTRRALLAIAFGIDLYIFGAIQVVIHNEWLMHSVLQEGLSVTPVPAPVCPTLPAGRT